jgi:hypothetical protein
LERRGGQIQQSGCKCKPPSSFTLKMLFLLASFALNILLASLLLRAKQRAR